MPGDAEAFFLPAGLGQRLCIHHPARGNVRGAVLYLHPFTEEMNKSRRMAALAARALANAGWAVLQIDLHGCGDSSGNFADASWAGWLDDALLGAHWLRQRHAGAPLCLWGLRTGALLAAQAAARLPAPVDLLLWQPVVSGKQALQQFLRLAATANLQQGDGKAALDQARSDLAAGRAVDIAGYALPPLLAAGLEAAQLDLPAQPGRTAHVAWLEVTSRTPAALLPASSARVQAWRDAGHAVTAQAVTGPAFWQTQEIEDAPELIATTVAAMGAARQNVAA